jgi:hypothetical protein
MILAYIITCLYLAHNQPARLPPLERGTPKTYASPLSDRIFEPYTQSYGPHTPYFGSRLTVPTRAGQAMILVHIVTSSFWAHNRAPKHRHQNEEPLKPMLRHFRIVVSSLTPKTGEQAYPVGVVSHLREH